MNLCVEARRTKVIMQIRERSHGCRMSDVRYAFSAVGRGGTSWDGDDYHANYSAFEQFALCAHHLQSTSALGPAVDVCFCHHILQHLSQGYRRRRGKQRRSAGSALRLWKIWGGVGGGWGGPGEEALLYIVHALNSLSFSLCSYPWLLSALKRLG